MRVLPVAEVGARLEKKFEANEKVEGVIFRAAAGTTTAIAQPSATARPAVSGRPRT